MSNIKLTVYVDDGLSGVHLRRGHAIITMRDLTFREMDALVKRLQDVITITNAEIRRRQSGNEYPTACTDGRRAHETD